MIEPINYLAVVAAAIVAMIVGSLWYGPLFGRFWTRLRGKDPASTQGMKFPLKEMVLQLIAALVSAYVLAYFVSILMIMDWQSALALGFLLWLGFQATLLIHDVLWDKRSWGLYVLTASHQLVSVLLMSLVIGLWH